jgi:Copine
MSDGTGIGSEAPNWSDDDENDSPQSLYDEDRQSLSTRLHLRLYASKLPRDGPFRRNLPNTYCQVVKSSDDRQGANHQEGPCHQPKDETRRKYIVLGKTEVVYSCTNPEWTEVIQLEHQHGSTFHFQVHLLAVHEKIQEEQSDSADETEHESPCKPSSLRSFGRESSTSSRRQSITGKTQHLGTALFEVTDILGVRHGIRSKRLPNGGFIYVKIEEVRTDQRHERSSLSRSFHLPDESENSFQPRSSIANNFQPRLQLRLQVGVQDLLRAHNGKWRATTRSFFRTVGSVMGMDGPQLIYEVATRSEHTADGRAHASWWTTVFRSQPITMNVHSQCPIWDPVDLDFSRLFPNEDSRVWTNETHAEHEFMRFQVKLFSSKSPPELIGLSETTMRHLLRIAPLRPPPGSDEDSLDDFSDRGGSSIAEEDHSSTIPEARQPASVEKTGSAEPKSELRLQRSYKKTKEVGRLIVKQAYVIDDLAERSFSPGKPDGTTREEDTSSVVDMRRLTPSGSTRQLIRSLPTTAHLPTFADYVENQRCQLDFCVAIDFTSSNGNPALESSLHYRLSNAFNDYEETITSIGTVLSRYGENNEYSVWGFGAKFPSSGNDVQHIFLCGKSSTVHNVEGILTAYRSVFEEDFCLSGPTVFDRVIQAAAVRAKKAHETMSTDNLRYTVLLIVTDGITDTIDETRRKLAAYSSLPLSVIFVGLGRNDFHGMRRLCQPVAADGANNEQQQMRPNATFVELRRHQHTPTSLGEEALRNIPSQLVLYMRSRGF